MTYLDLLRDAVHKLDKGDITLGEYDRMLEPLKQEIQPERKPGHWINEVKKWLDPDIDNELALERIRSIVYGMGEEE